MKILSQKYCIIAFATLLCLSCGTDWLDVKKNQKIVSPESLDDLQAIMDNEAVLNEGKGSYLGEVSSDNFFCQSSNWVNSNITQKNAYVWEQDLVEFYPGIISTDWGIGYRRVFYANVVIEKLEKLNLQDQRSEEIYGQALFWRAYSLFELSQIYCAPYGQNPVTTLGLPLPLNPDINIRHKRSSLSATYDRIISDLQSAVEKLPEKSVNKARPCKTAAYTVLSRVNMQMNDYLTALKNCEEALSINTELIDYNDIDPNKPFPFEKHNKEIILHITMQYLSNGVFNNANLLADTLLISKHLNTDLRLRAFYTPNGSYHTFKGMYTGSQTMFSGIAIDEIYLNYMEAAMRSGKRSLINNKLAYWINNRYSQPINTENWNDSDILEFILDERRKQLVFRGIRWSDIRRFNNWHKTNIQLTRKINGQEYTLLPNESRYVFQIPKEVTELNKGIVANVR